MMTAKEYLSQAKKLRIKIEQKERLLKEMREKTLCFGSRDIKPDKVQRSLDNGSRLEEQVVEYAEFEEEVRADVERYLICRNSIINTIQSMNDTRYIMVIHKKWIEEKSFEEIAVEMKYNFNHVRKIYWKAMKEMDRIIKVATQMQHEDVV